MSGSGLEANGRVAARAPRRRRGSRLARALGGLLLAAALVFVAGFCLFANSVATARPPVAPKADAAVVLTGGPQRIDDAAGLLESGATNRLLISGVYERTSADAIAAQSPALRRFLDCCVDIGYAARDTRGNAAEARDWVLANGFRSLIVVTAAFHMPRSLEEIASELPDVQLVAYPVNPDGRDFSRWPRDPHILRILLVEYVKYLVVRVA